MIYVKDLIEVCNGKLLCGDINLPLNNFSKDTRLINKDDVYIGIKGESFELLRLKGGNGSLHIPDEQATWSVAYSNELSDSDVANPEYFLTAYQKQLAGK